MKRKVIYHIACLFGLLTILSCTDDAFEKNKVDIVTGQKAWTAVRVAIPTMIGTQTRALSDEDQHGQAFEGDERDNAIKSVRIVFYNQAGTVALAKDYGSFTGPSFTTEAIELEKGEYDVLALINPIEAVKQATQTGKSKADFEAAGDFSYYSLYLLNKPNTPEQDKGVFMSNAKGYVKTNSAHWKTTQADAVANPVPVVVERAFAKLYVRKEIQEIKGATQAYVDRFGANVINQKMYWMRKPAQAIQTNGTATTEAVLEQENMSDYSLIYRYKSYATDPNMQLDSHDIHILKNTFFYKKQNPTTPFYMAGAGWNDEGMYVTENTMNAEAQNRLVTTEAVLEIFYQPEELTFTDVNIYSWLEYKEKRWTLKEFIDVAKQSQNGASDAHLGVPAGFGASVKDFDLSSEESIVKVFSAYTVAQEQTYEDNGKPCNTKSWWGGTDNLLKFYYNALGYFMVPLRHFDDTQQPKKHAYGRYGVVRNNVYKIRVNSIKGPGLPEIPDPIDVPDDNDEHQISVSMEVVPWTLVESEINFSEPKVSIIGISYEDGQGEVSSDKKIVTLHGQAKAVIKFKVTEPVGGTWSASITNGLDFELKAQPEDKLQNGEMGATIGIASASTTYVAYIRPLKKYTGTPRFTQVYLTLNGKEIQVSPGYQGEEPGPKHRTLFKQVE